MKIFFSVHAGDSWGHVQRTIGVAQYLQSLGHDILFCSKNTVKNFVENHGVRFVSNEQTIGHTDLIGRNTLNQVQLICHSISVETACIQEFSPDIIVRDPIMITNIPNLKKKCKVVCIPNATYLHFLHDTSCFSLEVREYMQNKIMSMINSVRYQFGESHIRYSEVFTRADKVILAGIKSFDLNNAIADSTEFVGYHGNISTSLPSDNGKTCFIALGTGIKSPELISTVLERCRNRFDKIYLSCGRFIDPSLFSEFQNVVVKKFWDNIPIVDLVISHGGWGTTQQCLILGLKQLVIPWHLDHYVQGHNLTRTNSGFWLEGTISDMQIIPDFSKFDSLIEKALESSPDRVDFYGFKNNLPLFADTILN